MGTRGKHSVRKPTVWGRSPELVTVPVASAAAVIVAVYGAVTHPASIRPATVSWASATQTQTLSRARKAANVVTVTGLPSLPAKSAATPLAPGSLVLTARDYSMCPSAAAACVDLT